MTDDMIAAHLRSALKQIERGEYQRAQINIEYARNRMRDAVGELPPPEQWAETICQERWSSLSAAEEGSLQDRFDLMHKPAEH
jgi:hypothetical protein